MRRILPTLALLALLVGCGDSSGPSNKGTLTFTLDPVTCSGRAGNIELFIDSQSQGTFAFTAGVSKSFTVDAGSHVAAAQEVGGSQASFGSQQVTVPANGTFVLTLQCS